MRAIAYLTILVALVSGCHSTRGGGSRQVSPLTPVAREIQRRGYQVKESLIVPPSAWEVSTFRMRNKRLFTFRANQPMPNASDTFCRFSFFEETYDSVEDARNRLAKIHEADPNGPAEEEDYTSTMRAAFRVGNVTYVLQTDAAIFWDEVQRLTKALTGSTRGAELTRALDALKRSLPRRIWHPSGVRPN